ncbi:DUF3142 domain-containing protein [Geothrix sp. PMB-07]|uniref:DUF3142 domain-containing protein n=1 Tax=Geothrix sp. PMB-07 TaxID=3068640 RepID=UPI002742107C|nr:DUF3142 domain-containing protein [Geothrix sp. PMB-07]WLT33369.1 DUF3142 domain-containing protein [Geothrix sp. PMB-07]
MLLAALVRCGREPVRVRRLPMRMLWAWESPQDLRFLHQGEGVAFLAGELRLEGSSTRWVPRRNPLWVNPGTVLLAVLRVESRAAQLTEAQSQALIERASGLLSLPQVRGLQIDFDARDSERAFYVRALKGLRSRLPEATPLSITALASWCLEDDWLSQAGLSGVVDEAVPMFFRMGNEAGSIRRRLGQGVRFREPLSRFSAGISTDEPLPRLSRGRRVYAFHPGRWTAEAWAQISRELP